MKFDKKLIDDVAKKAEKQLDFKELIGGVVGTGAELVDGFIFKIALHALNDNYADELPDEVFQSIEAFFVAFTTDDWSNLDDVLVEQVNSAIDIPYLDETQEGTLIGAILHALVDIAIKYRDSK